MNKSAQKAIVAISILMLLLPLSGALAQTTNPTWHIQTIDDHLYAFLEPLGNPSLVLDSAGNPHVSYSHGGLRYAVLTGNKWQIQALFSGSSPDSSSLALDSQGNPHFAYSTDSRYIAYVYWNGTNLQDETVDKEDSVGVTPIYLSLALDSSDKPHIAYANGEGLRYASWTGTKWNIQIVDSSFSGGVCLVIDSMDRPHISYGSSTVNYALWDGSKWITLPLDSTTTTDSSSLVLDSQGNPYICYVDSNNSLKSAFWNGSGWNLQVIDHQIRAHCSLVLDNSGKFYAGYVIQDEMNTLKCAATYDGTNWVTQNVTQGYGIVNSALAVDANDNLHICYSFKNYEGHGSYTGQLYYATLENPDSMQPPTPSILPAPSTTGTNSLEPVTNSPSSIPNNQNYLIQTSVVAVLIAMIIVVAVVIRQTKRP
jgi:hypothetical protein